MLRIAIYAAALLLVQAASALGQEASLLDEPGLREYTAQVLERNSALAAASSAGQAAVERIRPAGALPDPIVSFGMMSVPVPSFNFGREAMTQLPIGILQAFPFPGKQSARTRVARGDSSIAATGVELTAAVLTAYAGRAYFQIAYARSALEVWRMRVQLADQAAGTAKTMYETARTTQADLLRATLEQARLKEAGHQLFAEVEVAVAEADALRGGPGESVNVPVLTDAGDPWVTAVIADARLDLDTLLSVLRDANPELRVAAARVERAAASAHLFSVAARPDFVVGLQTGVRFAGREPFLSAVVGVSVPLWAGRKQSPSAQAAELDLVVAEQLYEDLRARLEGELRVQISLLDALRERVAELKEVILPLAEAASSTTLQSYGVGALDLTAVLDVQDDLFQTHLQLIRLIADYGTQRVALAALVGEEWYR